MNITTVGIDLAKSVFQVHGVDARGKVVLRRQLRREQVARYFVNLASVMGTRTRFHPDQTRQGAPLNISHALPTCRRRHPH
jgi:hypothetical protein